VFGGVLLEPRGHLRALNRRPSRQLDHRFLALRLHGPSGGRLALWQQRVQGACPLSRDGLDRGGIWLLLAGSFVMFILGITRTSVANAVVLQSAAPLASALFGRGFHGERLARPTLVAIGAAIAGVALMFAGALGGGDLVGNTLALGVAILFGGNIVVVRAARSLDLVPATVLAGVLRLGHDVASGEAQCAISVRFRVVGGNGFSAAGPEPVPIHARGPTPDCRPGRSAHFA
jgi:EamA-like transporter family protein